MTIVFWIVIAMVFYTIGEYFSKKYANTSLKSFGLISWLGYSINAFCFLPALAQYNSLTILGTVWNVLYMVLTLFVGLVLFKETITTMQMVGLCFAFVSIILMSL